MFRPQTTSSFPGASAFRLLELIFHSSVRNLRRSHGNAVIGLLLTMMQTVMLVLVFYVMMEIMGMRQIAIRGDFLLYVMSGIFIFITHTQTFSAVLGADGPTSAMMKHAPMNTIVAIASAALAQLYTQILSASVILYIYHAAFTPITIYEPIAALSMVLLAWGTGIAVGMIFRAALPWAPGLVTILAMLWQRANMIASGKMFLANMMTAKMLALFDWNPLFHIIDQTRGFVFINYHPHYSSISYPVKVMAVCFAIGLMGEFYTRGRVSLSWTAKG